MPQTLKHIVVNTIVVDADIDPLIGIPSEFEDMRTKNIIETVTIAIVDRSRASCRQGDDWGRLDEVLTTPGWFSLKRVSLTIKITNRNRITYDNNGDKHDDGDELEEIYRELPKTQFPRLSSSDFVSFNFEVIWAQI